MEQCEVLAETLSFVTSDVECNVEYRINNISSK